MPGHCRVCEVVGSCDELRCLGYAERHSDYYLGDGLQSYSIRCLLPSEALVQPGLFVAVIIL
jgi:hypothetical protein